MKLKYIVRVITPKINKKKNTKTMKKQWKKKTVGHLYLNRLEIKILVQSNKVRTTSLPNQMSSKS